MTIRFCALDVMPGICSYSKHVVCHSSGLSRQVPLYYQEAVTSICCTLLFVMFGLKIGPICTSNSGIIVCLADHDYFWKEMI